MIAIKVGQVGDELKWLRALWPLTNIASVITLNNQVSALSR